MGIKLHCPNGHKLNLKSFLAGKKGVCPHCGASFRIPNEKPNAADTAPSQGGTATLARATIAPSVASPSVATPAALKHAAAPAAVAAPVIRAAIAAQAIPQGRPMAMPATPLPQTMVHPVSQPVVRPAQQLAPSSGLPGPSLMPPPPPGAIDPIAEAPMAAWYVRPPSGGQYGPARGDVMRKWIGEGRVSGDSLVWREGWTDWRNAGVLFPSLNAGTNDLAPAGPTLGGALGAPALGALPRTSRATVARPQGNGFAIGIVIFLVLLCIGLVVALVFVLGGVN